MKTLAEFTVKKKKKVFVQYNIRFANQSAY